MACRNEFGRRKEAKDRSCGPQPGPVVRVGVTAALAWEKSPKDSAQGLAPAPRHAAGRERGLGVGVGVGVGNCAWAAGSQGCKVRAEL